MQEIERYFEVTSQIGTTTIDVPARRILVHVAASQKLDAIHVERAKLGPTGSTMTQDNMSSDEVHKNSMCKDGRCPDTGKKLDNGGNTTQDNSKTDGTTQ